MVAQFVARIRMQEDIQRAVVQHEPRHDFVEARGVERDLVRPRRVRADEAFVKAAEFDDRAEPFVDDLAKRPRGVAAGRIEIDVRMPTVDGT